MLKDLAAVASIAAFMLPVVPALAQDGATVKVSKSEEYGRYLTDAEGRALYLFTTDQQGKGDAAAKVSCEGECLDRWPPLYTQGEPQAGNKIDASLLGTTKHDGKTIVTYNGWPLYYFFKDKAPGQTTGQDVHGFGGEWYLVSPGGEKVEEH